MDIDYAILAENLSRSFKDKTAVSDLSLNIKKGEIYAFLGPNGAGKSTTVKMLITLLDPTGGSARICGFDTKTQADKVRLLIGVALQEASLDESQTGIEFLRVQGSLYGLSRIAVEHRIEELKSLIDIGNALNKQIKTYSGGMKRRLDMAASIIHRPQVLFLDEPTTGLDPISRAKVWKEVVKLNKDVGMTIFLTTQYLEEADQLADRVGIISDGKLVAEGSPKELKESVGDDVIVADIGEDQPDILGKLRQIETVNKVEIVSGQIRIYAKSGSTVIGKVAVELEKHGVMLKSLTLRTTTLDDVFLKVTGNNFEN